MVIDTDTYIYVCVCDIKYLQENFILSYCIYYYRLYIQNIIQNKKFFLY